MMSVDQMRTEIKKVYPGKKWDTRVTNMKDSQVIAIYNKMLDRKELK